MICMRSLIRFNYFCFLFFVCLFFLFVYFIISKFLFVFFSLRKIAECLELLPYHGAVAYSDAAYYYLKYTKTYLSGPVKKQGSRQLRFADLLSVVGIFSDSPGSIPKGREAGVTGHDKLFCFCFAFCESVNYGENGSEMVMLFFYVSEIGEGCVTKMFIMISRLHFLER